MKISSFLLLLHCCVLVYARVVSPSRLASQEVMTDLEAAFLTFRRGNSNLHLFAGRLIQFPSPPLSLDRPKKLDGKGNEQAVSQ